MILSGCLNVDSLSLFPFKKEVKEFGNNLVVGVQFSNIDVTTARALDYTVVYMFDWVFSDFLKLNILNILRHSDFKLLICCISPAVLTSFDIEFLILKSDIQVTTTGREKPMMYIYEKIERVNINKDQ